MNRNQLAILVVILVVLGGAGLYVVNHNKESWTATGGRAGQKLFPNLQVNDVAEIDIKSDGEVDLTRKADGWTVKQRNDYPANFTQIRELLVKAGDWKIAQSDDIGPSQLARMHLEAPGKGENSATMLEFKDDKGKALETLLIGKKHVRKTEGEAPGPGGEQGYPDGRYVMLESDPKTVLTISDPLNSVEGKGTEWLDKDFFKVEQPRTIEFVSTNATNSWKLARALENGPWAMAGLEKQEDLDTNKVTSLAGALTYPSFLDVATETDAAKTGMDKPQEVIIETFGHEKYDLKIGAKSGADQYYLKVAVTGDFPTRRTPGKDEKPDDEKKLDKEFADKLKQQQDRLKQEQSLGKWTYLVNSWLIDPYTRSRSQLMVDKNAKKATLVEPEKAESAEPDTSAAPPQ